MTELIQHNKHITEKINKLNIIKKYKKDVETCFNNLNNFNLKYDKELIFFNKNNDE